MRYLLITITLLFSTTNIFAQSSYTASKESINQKLALLSTFYQILTSYDEEDDSYFDPDSLSVVIAEDLVTLLELEGWKNFDPKDFPELEHTYNAPFHVLSFGYHCGGSAGWIPTTIIIKQKGYSYEYFSMAGTECGFYDFYQLKDEVYLCLAYAPGSGACRNSGFYAIDFGVKGGKFTPVFGDKTGFFICNSDIYFDDDEKLLTIDVGYAFVCDGCDCKTYFAENGCDFFLVECDSEQNDRGTITLTTVFDGDKFVRP